MFGRKIFMPRKRWLILPVETKVRELDGKALLAFEAAERGWGVILGEKSMRKRSYLPGGMYIEKSIAIGRLSDILYSMQKGCRISALCEEGLIYISAEEYGRRKVEMKSFDLLDIFFSWGSNQANDMVLKLGCNPDRIVVSGNPRFDLLRPDFRNVFSKKAGRIRQIYGPFILINTKFPLFNNYYGYDNIVEMRRSRGRITTAEQERFEAERMQYQRANYEKFMEMIGFLSKQNPHNQIIIRPHPSERHDPWISKASNMHNVKVVYEGNVAEWILASELCIHHNCTTGAEAYLLGKVPVSYRPVRDERFDLFLPNALSMEVNNIGELLETASMTLNGVMDATRTDDVTRRKIAGHYIANMEGKLACERIMDSLENIDIPEDNLSFSTYRFGVMKDLTMEQLRILRDRMDFNRQGAKGKYARQKFGGIYISEMHDLLGAIVNVSNKYASVKIVPIESKIFCLYK